MLIVVRLKICKKSNDVYKYFILQNRAIHPFFETTTVVLENRFEIKRNQIKLINKKLFNVSEYH